MKSMISNLNSAIALSIFEFQSKANATVAKRNVRFCTMIMTTIMCISMVFAASTFDNLVSQIIKLYKDLLPVFNVCALLFFVIFVAIGFFSSDQQTSRFGQQAAKKVVIGWLLICMAPWLLTKAYELLGTDLVGKSAEDIKSITDS